MGKKTEMLSVRVDKPTKDKIKCSNFTLEQIIQRGLIFSDEFDYIKNDKERRQYVMDIIGDDLKYKGLQEVDGTSYFRIELGKTKTLFGQTTSSLLLSTLYHSFCYREPIRVNGRGDKFIVERLLVEFAYKDDILPSIHIDLNHNNKNSYRNFIYIMAGVIDRLTIERGFCVLWCTHYYGEEEKEEVTRGNLNSWREEVLKEGKCACCGGDKYLEAHHIFSFNSYPDLRDDVKNGVALCKWCHKKLHSYYGKEPTPTDLANFFNRFATNNGGSLDDD